MTLAAPARPKKPKRISPTALTLAQLRKLGFVAGVVEHWNPHARIRQDLFGFIDLIAVLPGVGVVGVQATSNNGGNHAARRSKSMNNPALLAWLKSGGRFEIWSWKQSAKGQPWELRREEIFLRQVQEWIGSGNYSPPVPKERRGSLQAGLPLGVTR